MTRAPSDMRTFIRIVESASTPESPKHSPQPHVVDDDGDVAHAKTAFWDDDAYLRYWKTAEGEIVVQSIQSSDNVRGRDMLRWVNRAYGLPIVVVEVTGPAFGFFQKMRREGLVARVEDAEGEPSRYEAISISLD